MLFRKRKEKRTTVSDTKPAKALDTNDTEWLDYDTGRDDAANGKVIMPVPSIAYAMGVSEYLVDKSNNDIPETNFWNSVYECDTDDDIDYIVENVTCENCGHDNEITIWIEDYE